MSGQSGWRQPAVVQRARDESASDPSGFQLDDVRLVADTPGSEHRARTGVSAQPLQLGDGRAAVAAHSIECHENETTRPQRNQPLDLRRSEKSAAPIVERENEPLRP